jgi:tetratricopeptide (TPR) repeat protein
LREYDKAIDIYSQGLKKFPTNSMMLSFRGNAYLVKQNYKDALKDYYQAIQYQENVIKELQTNPTYVNASNDSISLYQRGFSASIYISVAEANFALGEYEQALKHINKGIEIAPEIKEFGKENYYFVRGNIYVGMGKYKLAIEDFNKSIQLNAESSPAYVERAVARVMLNTNETISSYSIQETFIPNWGFPAKMSVKKSDINILEALMDCNEAIKITKP